MNGEAKNYAKGFFVRSRTFQDGGEILKVSGKAGEFREWLARITDDQGNFRMIITRRRQPSDSGVTHSAYEDTYKPSGSRRDESPAPAADNPATGQADPAVGQTERTDDLPF